ncbi:MULTISPECIES: ABC transporter ATP-binding protein [unclassified Actinobaculum]|uniref:ABC transporter ATP-binding protein n=1 Tax=unclassified Actinobaculum TaxID=2609299 RepID=UPI000D527C43|nr:MULTISPECIES: ABC transporter ATP-binding protein [unclassified Actinobaculum]AWE42188.1 ABC transporter [Actinobaculum sp. 313]RTE50750.1 ABC transporter ATP-binding protein [Actinobaculum sp. 352]
MGHPIEAHGLVKHFGSLAALDRLDLTVEAGSVHGFLGPNGSGKSTTIRALLGLYHLDGGHMRVLGQNPATDAATINRSVAYVPGEVSLWPAFSGQQVLDAIAGLRGVRDVARERELIERFALDPTKRVRTYSTGNRRKVVLVAAFAAPVDVLLLDEPTSGLDPLMENIFRQCVQEVRQAGKTVLLSSHILSEVQELCTDVTIIRDGKTVEAGPLDHLRHLAARQIRLSGPPAQLAQFERGLAALREELATSSSDRATPVVSLPIGAATSDGDDGLVVEASGSVVPRVLELAVKSGLADITCTPASLEDLFLRHYQAVAR